MNQHDPYTLLLEGLCQINQIQLEQHLADCLRKTRPFVKKLRLAYRASPAKVNYGCTHNRAAYLLAYYPHYIEPIYTVLQLLPRTVTRDLFASNALQSCFFGAGPAPEVIGWLAYLQEYAPHVKNATAHLMDIHSDGWQQSRRFTQEFLAPHYWPNGSLALNALPFDVLECTSNWEGPAQQAVNNSKLFVMQNCLNDQVDQAHRIMENFLFLFRQLPPESVFIICDLNFNKVRKLMGEIEAQVVHNQLGTILRKVGKESIICSANIAIPKIVSENLFSGGDGLISKRTTRFHANVLVRT